MAKYRFGDICEVLNGRAYKQNELLSSGKYPILRVGNFFSSDRWYYSDMELPENKYCDYEDLLFAWSASFGPKIWDGGKVIYHYHIWKLIPNDDVADKFYLYYWLRHSVNRLTAGTHGSVMAHMTKGDMENQSIELPSLQTQKKISSILRTIDEKIHNNEAINNNLEQQAVLLFKQWFANFENHSEKMVETRFGKIPTSFKLMKNGELPMIVTDYVANGSFASLKANVKLYQEDNYAYFIRNTDLKSGTFEVFVDKHSYDFLSKSTLYGGEIIISNVGDVGSVFLCPKLNKPMTLGNNIIMLRPEQNSLKYYLYIWFKCLYGQALIQGIKGGSAQPKFNKTDFKNLPIYLPDDNLLEKFHKIVEPMFELIDKNNSENQHLAAMRDTLLPKLMSGELDVSNIEI